MSEQPRQESSTGPVSLAGEDRGKQTARQGR
jgi:hypothetical protein